MSTQKQERASQWERLYTDPSVQEELRQIVSESWQRSQTMEINRDILPSLTSSQELEKLKKDTKKLYVNSNSILNPIFESSHYSHLGALLFSPGGTIMELYGPPTFKQWAAKNHFVKGTCWSEDAIGTSIFSLGIGRPEGFCLSGRDCYAHFLLPGVYYFSSIYMPNGELAGGLALVAPFDKGNHYLQTIVSMAVRMIELQLLWFHMCESHFDV